MKIKIYTKHGENIFDNLDSKSIDVDFIQPIRESNCITIPGTGRPTTFPLSEILSLEIWLDGQSPTREVVQEQFDAVIASIGIDLVVTVHPEQ